MFRIVRRNHVESETLKQPMRHSTDKRIVFDQQDRPTPVARNILPGIHVVAAFNWLLRARQIHVECGSHIWVAQHFDLAAGLLHNSMHHREPESGSLSYFLRGKKWFEDTFPDLVAHACSGIHD